MSDGIDSRALDNLMEELREQVQSYRSKAEEREGEEEAYFKGAAEGLDFAMKRILELSV